jgi:hypothetical protein
MIGVIASPSISIRQPAFFPWCGFLHRLAYADKFVILDDVQFSRRDYDARCRLLCNFVPSWFSLSVIKCSSKTLIRDVKLCNSRNDLRFFRRILTSSYHSAPYLDDVLDLIAGIEALRSDWLIDYALASIDLLMRAFSIDCSLLLSSDLPETNVKRDARWLSDTCARLGGRSYLSGVGYSSKQSADDYIRNGVRLFYQRITGLSYIHASGVDFQYGLSALHFLAVTPPEARVSNLDKMFIYDVALAPSHQTLSNLRPIQSETLSRP